MKKFIYTATALLCVVAATSSLKAMEKEPAKAPEVVKSMSVKLQEYFNLKAFCASVSAIMLADRDAEDGEKNKNKDTNVIQLDAAAMKGIINAFIQSLKIGEFPITIGKETVKLNRYFNIRDLKLFLEAINNDYFVPKVQNRALAYAKGLKGCLLAQNVETDITGGHVKLTASLDAAIAYCENKQVSIEECINIHNLPVIYGYKIDDYCNIEHLKALTDQLLKKMPVSKEMILQCFNFKPLLRFIGCPENGLDTMNTGTHGIVTFLIDLTQDEGAAIVNLFDCFAHYKGLKIVDQDNNQKDPKKEPELKKDAPQANKPEEAKSAEKTAEPNKNGDKKPTDPDDDKKPHANSKKLTDCCLQ